MELNEQESTILRRKVDDLESENIRLQKELKELLSSSEAKKVCHKYCKSADTKHYFSSFKEKRKQNYDLFLVSIFFSLTAKTSPSQTDFGIIPEISKDNVYFNKKIKMLEQEATDLRRKVIEYEKEKCQLAAELETTKKRAKVVRSR